MQGVAAVEFGIVLIPLVVLVSGLVEFGHAIYQYETLTKSTRDAARYLSTYLPSDPAYPLASAQCLAVYGSTSCPSSGGTPLVAGLTTSMVVVCDASHTTGCSDASDPAQFSNVTTYDTNNDAVNASSQTGSINLVEVKIKGYPYSPIEPYLQTTILNLSALTFNNIVTVMRQVS
ncbi:TadE/TadG family type IV pilus assembly protein [Trinickia sp. YCB016]